MKDREELYFSTDVETDGPIPGVYSMLSFASALFNKEGIMLSTFSANLNRLEGAIQHPDTTKFWEQNKSAYVATRLKTQNPEDAMKKYVAWIETWKGSPVFVAYPAGFDFMWMLWYLNKFVGHSPFSHSALDIKTYACAILNKSYRESVKRNFPKEWFGHKSHSHVALDDAIEQGELFVNMLKWRREHVTQV